jgi:uncharacterized protein (TIGR03000 family)
LLGSGLVLPPHANATFRRIRYRPAPGPMPGSDWWRIYPWSPYNYGRNPYNPAIVYPYVYPYVVPYPYPVYPPPASPPPAPVVYRAASEPSVSGPLPSPPPGAALIRLHAPAEWAKVQFDGETTSTMGIHRTFVTPELTAGKTYRYDMTVTWTHDGKPMRVQRVVRVRAGQINEIDLSRPGSSELATAPKGE